MAVEAYAGPGGDFLGEGLPYKLGRNEMTGGAAARMRDVVKNVNHGAVQDSGDGGLESGSGDVAMRQQVLIQNGGNSETGES